MSRFSSGAAAGAAAGSGVGGNGSGSGGGGGGGGGGAVGEGGGWADSSMALSALARSFEREQGRGKKGQHGRNAGPAALAASASDKCAGSQGHSPSLCGRGVRTDLLCHALRRAADRELVEAAAALAAAQGGGPSGVHSIAAAGRDASGCVATVWLRGCVAVWLRGCVAGTRSPRGRVTAVAFWRGAGALEVRAVCSRVHLGMNVFHFTGGEWPITGMPFTMPMLLPMCCSLCSQLQRGAAVLHAHDALLAESRPQLRRPVRRVSRARGAGRRRRARHAAGFDRCGRRWRSWDPASVRPLPAGSC